MIDLFNTSAQHINRENSNSYMKLKSLNLPCTVLALIYCTQSIIKLRLNLLLISKIKSINCLLPIYIGNIT